MSRTQIINIIQSFLTYLLFILPPTLIALGCTQDAAGNLECSQAMISPKFLVLWVIPGIGFIKGVLLPWFTPGGWIRNLLGDKVAVVPTASTNATPGTVSPVEVRKAA